MRRLAGALACGALLLAAAAGLAGEGIWKWTDAAGVVHYADTPVPGAKRVDLNIQTYSPPAASTSGTGASPPPPAGSYYKSVEIWKPAPEENVVNAGGQVSVRIRVEPQLRRDDTLTLYLDGIRVDGFPENSQDYELPNIARGSHTLVATITGNNGQRLMDSSTVTFYVRQTSVAQPPVGPTLKPSQGRPRKAA